MTVDWNHETYEVNIYCSNPLQPRKRRSRSGDKSTGRRACTDRGGNPLQPTSSPPVKETAVSEKDNELDMEALIMGPAPGYGPNSCGPYYIRITPMQFGDLYGNWRRNTECGETGFCQAARKPAGGDLPDSAAPGRITTAGWGLPELLTGEEDLLGADPSRVR